MNTLLVLAGLVFFVIFLDPLGRRTRRARLKSLDAGSLSYAFFHPDALSGGGGERVLWQAVAAMQAKWTKCRISIYIRGHSLESAAVAAKIKVRRNQLHSLT